MKCFFRNFGLGTNRTLFHRTFAFTLVEVLVAVGVLGILSAGIAWLYSHSMYSYRITTWKQERTRQAEMFWNRLRKPLEEASDKLERKDLGGGNWTIQRTARPLLFKPAPTEDGKFMAWQIDHFDINSGIVTAIDTWSLTKFGSKILLSGPDAQNIVVLEDVASISIKASQITQKPGTFEEELDGSGEIIGSVLEISILLKPPPSFRAPDVSLVQNAKFKLVVKSEQSSNPSY